MQARKKGREMSRAEHMLISVRGLHWREVFMVPFTVFIDDSGSDPNQVVGIASAMIIPAGRIAAMEDDWKKLKEKEGFSDFHASAFLHKNEEADSYGWDDTKLKRVFKRVRKLTRKYAVQNFTFGVKKDDYKTLVPDELRQFTGKHPHTWAIRHVARFAELWRIQKGITPAFEWIHDFMKSSDPGRKEIEDVFEQAEEDSAAQGLPARHYTNLQFRPRKDLAGLQFVDLVAWTNYNFALEKYGIKEPFHYATTAWNDFNSMPKDKDLPNIHPHGVEWNFSVAVKPDHLRDWVKREMADGRALKRFKEFHERKKSEREAKYNAKKKSKH